MKRLAFVAFVACALACGRAPGPLSDASPEREAAANPSVAAAVSAPLAALALAEDNRDVGAVREDYWRSPEVAVRRRAARALARIADADSLVALQSALSDEDAEVVAWAAYGLGFGCKTHEEEYSRALAARAVSLPPDAQSGRVEVRSALARALGRCGGARAEAQLAAWVGEDGRWAEPASLALGDLAARRAGLDPATVDVLLDSASKQHATALFAFGRIDHVDDAVAIRLLSAARVVVSGPLQDARIFAVRALARAGVDAAPDLGKIAADPTAPNAERTESARGLARLGVAGQLAAAGALQTVLPRPGDALDLLRMAGDDFSVAAALLSAAGVATKQTRPALKAASRLSAPDEAIPEPLRRRLGALRCAASAALSGGAFDSKLLRDCAAPGTLSWERARLSQLVLRPLVAERRAAWLALTRSKNVVIVEASLEAIDAHPELGELARRALIDALRDPRAGVVATAAERLRAHPERALTVSARERKRGLDPTAPPPPLDPHREIDPAVAEALRFAQARSFPESALETRAALLDAAVALRAAPALALAQTLCGDPNVTLRGHAQKALRSLGDVERSCVAPTSRGRPPAALATRGGVLTLETDAGTLKITLDPELAPVTSARLVDLARAGFYNGMVVHRVVPGFVAQMGDPGGDGYGGADHSLRCETSPIPFDKGDVGMALSGRDTGSAQLFVTLSRLPHLDGDYARVGHAEGDWAALAEGDVVREVRVTE